MLRPTPGDPWGVEQHHWNTGAEENQQLNPRVLLKYDLQSACTLLSNIKSEMRFFKSNENIHKKEGGSYYVVSANKASAVTL